MHSVVWNWIFGKRETIEPSGHLNTVMRAMHASSRPCVLLRQGDGDSKIGGTPDSFSPEKWPKQEGKLLAFVAQLDLPEIRSANGPDWLPAEGRLFFFYDAERQPWGFDPADRGGWCVIFQQPGDNTSDLPVASAIPEQRVHAIASRSLPDASREHLAIDLKGISDEEFDTLYEASEAHFEGLPAHQVGGFPSPIQGDHMELEAQLASNGIYCGDSSGYESPRAHELKAGASDWVLLLQLDSDEGVDMMWGDLGRLYFWIREQDARRGDFSNVWLILQCS